MFAEDYSQRPVEQVGGTVIAHGVSADAIDEQGCWLARFDGTRYNAADVQNGVAELLRVLHLKPARRRTDFPGVPDLSPLFGVEAGAVQEQSGFLTLFK